MQGSILFKEAEKHSERLGPCGVLVDLCGTARPDVESRTALKQGFSAMNKNRNVKHVAIFTEANMVLRAAAQFVLRRTLSSSSFHRTRQEAIDAIESALK